MYNVFTLYIVSYVWVVKLMVKGSAKFFTGVQDSLELFDEKLFLDRLIIGLNLFYYRLGITLEKVLPSRQLIVAEFAS
jgi:hypothetical protein